MDSKTVKTLYDLLNNPGSSTGDPYALGKKTKSAIEAIAPIVNASTLNSINTVYTSTIQIKTPDMTVTSEDYYSALVGFAKEDDFFIQASIKTSPPIINVPAIERVRRAEKHDVLLSKEQASAIMSFGGLALLQDMLNKKDQKGEDEVADALREGYKKGCEAVGSTVGTYHSTKDETGEAFMPDNIAKLLMFLYDSSEVEFSPFSVQMIGFIAGKSHEFYAQLDRIISSLVEQINETKNTIPNFEKNMQERIQKGINLRYKQQSQSHSRTLRHDMTFGETVSAAAAEMTLYKYKEESELLREMKMKEESMKFATEYGTALKKTEYATKTFADAISGSTAKSEDLMKALSHFVSEMTGMKKEEK